MLFLRTGTHQPSVNTQQFHVPPTQCVCVLCGSQNKQLLFPCTALTDWFFSSQGSSELFTSLLDRNRPWGVSRQNVNKKIQCWPGDQHRTICQCLTGTQRQAARELISDPSPAAEQTRLLSFNRIQSRVVASFLPGRNTLSRHLYTMGLINSSLCCRKPQLTICVTEYLATLGHIYLGSFFLDPEDVKVSVWGNLKFIKGTGLP